MNKKLSKIISDYFKNKDEVIAVYLFGSYACGKNQPFSDIDIGILLNRIDQKFANQQKMRYLTELSRIIRKDVHPVILNSASEVLMKQIYSKGRCILINDSKKLAKYKMTMYARIADFAYYLNKMQKGFIRRTMEEAKRARKAETPKQPSRHLRSSAPYFYPDPDFLKSINVPSSMQKAVIKGKKFERHEVSPER